MKFREDINILRGISILLVTVFHFFPKILPNGYLGVDVFFVISGFLISLGILKNTKDNSFSYIDFYKRRIHRIIPAVLVMLLVITAFESMILLPSDLIKFSQSLQATLGFISNIYFFLTGGYFGGNDALKPLLHMWSLSIEEQFYLLFPFLFLLIIKFIKTSKKLLLAVIFIFLISYFLNIYLETIGGGNASFFLLPTRIWQFLVGTIAAIILHERAVQPFNLKYISVIGLIIMAVSNYLKIPFIPEATLISLGTFLIIINSMRVVPNVINNTLSFLGKISFSLYLWHWPIASFLNYYNIESIELWQSIIGLLLSVVIGYLSWKYIEEKFRKPLKTKKLLLGIGIVYLILIGLTQNIINNSGFPNRFNKDINEVASAIDSNFRCPKLETFIYGGAKACYIKVNNNKNYDLAVLGNSHSLMYAPVIAESYRKSILVVPLNGCTPTVSMNLNTLCRKQFEQNLQAVKNDPKIKAVVIGTTWGHRKMIDSQGIEKDINHTEFNESILQTISALRQSNKEVYLIGPIATPTINVPAELSTSLRFDKNIDHIEQKESYKIFAKDFQKDIDFWKLKMGDHFITTYEDLCDNDFCYFRRNGETYFADEGHLSQTGAKTTIESFNKAFQSLLKKS